MAPFALRCAAFLCLSEMKDVLLEQGDDPSSIFCHVHMQNGSHRVNAVATRCKSGISTCSRAISVLSDLHGRKRLRLKEIAMDCIAWRIAFGTALVAKTRVRR